MTTEVEQRKEAEAPVSSSEAVAIEVKNAAAVLVDYGRVIKSLGLASWSLGIAFAGCAVGLRFLDAGDMEAPEFIACFVFAALLVAFGIVIYVLESQGYVKMITEIAPAHWPGLPAAPGDEAAGGAPPPGESPPSGG